MERLSEKKTCVNQLSVCVLASGSKGNAIYISDSETSILIDAGLSGKEIQRRMHLRGIIPESINAILVSHEHTDHVTGAGVFSRRFKIPLYMNPKTHRAAEKKIGQPHDLKFFECGETFAISSLKIHPFSISHDAVDPAGFTIETNNKKIGVATDLGIANLVVKQHLKNCNVLILEANHDIEMLLSNENYPWELKQRVKSRKGHLSNEEARELLEELINNELSHLVLAHLSQENNTPEKVYEVIKTAVRGFEVTLSIAGQHEPEKMIQI